MSNLTAMSVKAKLRLTEAKLNDALIHMKYLQKRVKICEFIISELDPNAVPPKGIVQQKEFFRNWKTRRENMNRKRAMSYENTIERNFINVLNKNAGRSNGRRYSYVFLMICFILRSLSAHCYDFFAQIIALPAKATLYRHFKNAVNHWKGTLLSVANVSDVIQLFRSTYNLKHQEKVEIVLGVDAMSLEPNVKFSNVPIGSNYLFLFHIMPLSSKQKSMTLHAQAMDSGVGGDHVKERMAQLIQMLKQHNFIVKYKATDGDRTYTVWHDEAILKWWPTYCEKGLEEALKVIENEEAFPIGDFLHLLKNARSKIMNSDVTIFYDGFYKFNANDLESILHLGKPLTDYNTVGKMKDSYALDIFTIPNYFLLLKNGKISEAYYILPYALWTEAVRNPTYTPQQRLDILTVVLEIFARHKKTIATLNKDKVSQNKSEGKIQFVCSEKAINRILNTIIAMIREIRIKPFDLALDRMGTHPIECAFGLIRILSHYKHDWETALTSLARQLIVTEFSNAIGLGVKIKGRVNIAGVKLTGSNIENVYAQQININVHDWIESFYWMMMTRNNNKEDTWGKDNMEDAARLDRMNEWIKSFYESWQKTGITIEKCYTGGPVSHLSILNRIMLFDENVKQEDPDCIHENTVAVDEEKEECI